MKPVTILMTAGSLALLGTVHAQQAETPEEEAEGIPATQHQEEALRDVSSDLFNRLDANRDGAISREEAQAESSLSGSWNEYDQNGDQKLDQSEFAAYNKSSTETEDVEIAQGVPTVEGVPVSPHQQQAIREQLVEDLDKDGDGGISQSEAQGESALISEWDQLDRNDDGKLDSSELEELEQ